VRVGGGGGGRFRRAGGGENIRTGCIRAWQTVAWPHLVGLFACGRIWSKGPGRRLAQFAKRGRAAPYQHFEGSVADWSIPGWHMAIDVDVGDSRFSRAVNF